MGVRSGMGLCVFIQAAMSGASHFKAMEMSS